MFILGEIDRIARHFLAGAEQSSGPFAPLLMFFFLVHPVTWTGRPRFPRQKDNQVGPLTRNHLIKSLLLNILAYSWIQPLNGMTILIN